MSKNLVIVESPAKAKTIEKYLGKDYRVLSSVGHIRKDTQVDIENDFTVTYEINPDHKKVVQELKKAVKAADTIWLATDEDREGESISWHLIEVLDLPKNTHRITFHEITKPALEAAIASPRTIDMDMVASQQARQTLDLLVGYDLSGVVRKKVPGATSAGRVQSPALRLIVEKEREIADFTPTTTFKITGDFTKQTTNFPANLEQPAPTTESAATKILQTLSDTTYTVADIELSETQKANPIPLTTAALQIEASSRLGFSASTTMRAAQSLYQAGLITYHRTDSLNLSSQALKDISHYILQTFGKTYLKTRRFKTKSASAQEAHEAIRPTHITQTSAGKNPYEKKLYQLIWSRTVATQMANAKVNKTTIKIATTTPYSFLAKGETIIFDGFLKVYGNAKDTELPKLSVGDQLLAKQITARQTFSKPPARYTEGSLVKKLEELGIGRPSTYASILSALQTRGYVVKGDSEGEQRKILEIQLKNQKITKNTVSETSGSTKGKLLPTPIGELISDFLGDHFDQIVDYGFTAEVEKELDQIAEAKLDRVKMLKTFYKPFSQLVAKADKADRYNSATLLGQDPKTKHNIYAKVGKNGSFIQLGENEKVSGEKPRFVPLPEGKTVKTVTLADALKQLSLPSLPRSLGHAKDGTEIIAASGPFGPYLKAGKFNISLGNQDPYTITLKQAEPLYQAKLDSIIADWGDISIIKGVYGPYIKGPGRANHVKINKDQDPTKITLEQATEMLKNKPQRTRRGSRFAKKSTKKSTKKSIKKA